MKNKLEELLNRIASMRCFKCHKVMRYTGPHGRPFTGVHHDFACDNPDCDNPGVSGMFGDLYPIFEEKKL